MEIPTEVKKKRYFGTVGHFGQHIMYRFRYVDKVLGMQVYVALSKQKYIVTVLENDDAVTFEIIAPIKNNVSLILKKERLSRNIERDTLFLEEIQKLLKKSNTYLRK